MAEEIGFENGRNSNFQGLVTLTLTLDQAIRHTVVHHSSTSTYIPNFIQIEETFCGRTDGRTFFPPLILLGRLLEVDLIKPLYSNHVKVDVQSGTEQACFVAEHRIRSSEKQVLVWLVSVCSQNAVCTYKTRAVSYCCELSVSIGTQ